MTLDLDPIKKRVAAATPGPWAFDSPTTHIVHDLDGQVLDLGAMLMQEDAEFVMHARQDIPALVAEVERLRGTALYPDEGRSL